MTPTIDAVLGGLGNKAVDTLRLTLGAAWDSFTADERKDCEQLLFSLAKAHLLELAGYDVSDYVRTLGAAFLQWKVVGKAVALAAVQSAATEVFGLAGAFAGGALAAVVKGAV